LRQLVFLSASNGDRGWAWKAGGGAKYETGVGFFGPDVVNKRNEHSIQIGDVDRCNLKLVVKTSRYVAGVNDSSDGPQLVFCIVLVKVAAKSHVNENADGATDELRVEFDGEAPNHTCRGQSSDAFGTRRNTQRKLRCQLGGGDSPVAAQRSNNFTVDVIHCQTLCGPRWSIARKSAAHLAVSRAD
jgi:hypothetical protein